MNACGILNLAEICRGRQLTILSCSTYTNVHIMTLKLLLDFAQVPASTRTPLYPAEP